MSAHTASQLRHRAKRQRLSTARDGYRTEAAILSAWIADYAPYSGKRKEKEKPCQGKRN